MLLIETKLKILSFCQENEKSKDVMIEHRFHRQIIGAKGENIREIRDKFNQVQITFPDPGKKSDIVTLRGPKGDVDKAHKFLQNFAKELVSFFFLLYRNKYLS